MDLDKWPTRQQLEQERKEKRRIERKSIRMLQRMQERRMRDLKRDPDIIQKEDKLRKKYPNIKLKRKDMPKPIAEKVKKYNDFFYKRPFL